MQVEELLRSHPNLGEFISQTKAEVQELTKELELRIRAGYFEIVKAAEQLMQLASSVQSSRDLVVSPLVSKEVYFPALESTVRAEDEVWDSIDAGRYGEACAKCSLSLSTAPSEEMVDLSLYLRTLCDLSFLCDSQDLLANKLVGYSIITRCEKTDPAPQTEAVPDLGELLLGKFISDLIAEVSVLMKNLTLPHMQDLHKLLLNAQMHFQYSFLEQNVEMILTRLSVDISSLQIPSDATVRIRQALDEITPELVSQLSAVISNITNPELTLQLRFPGEDKHGIVCLGSLTRSMWVKQLYESAVQKLDECSFFQQAERLTLQDFVSGYETENNALLRALFEVSSSSEVRETLSQVLVAHLQHIKDKAEATAQTCTESRKILAITFFLHKLVTAASSLEKLLVALNLTPVCSPQSLLELWSHRVQNKDMLSIIREVRSVCGDEVSFCTSVLPQVCADTLTSDKRTIADLFGLPETATEPKTQETLPDLPSLALLQLLPRFFPHLVYT